jgi:hypothetical protein
MRLRGVSAHGVRYNAASAALSFAQAASPEAKLYLLRARNVMMIM